MVCELEQGWNKTLQGCGPPGTEFDTPDLESEDQNKDKQWDLGTVREEALECHHLLHRLLKPLDDTVYSIAKEARGQEWSIQQEESVLILKFRQIQPPRELTMHVPLPNR